MTNFGIWAVLACDWEFADCHSAVMAALRDAKPLDATGTTDNSVRTAMNATHSNPHWSIGPLSRMSDRICDALPPKSLWVKP